MTHDRLIEEELTYSVIGAFYEVYNQLGFGFLEHIYVLALEQELLARGHKVDREVRIDVYYKDSVIGHQRLDMIVDDKLVVEVKSTHELHRKDPRIVYSYVHATKLEVGLLLHFGPEARFFRVISRNTRERSAKSAQSGRSVSPSALMPAKRTKPRQK